MKSIIPTIQKEFNKVISYSQNIDNPQTTVLLEKWAEAKADLYQRLDQQLIHEYGEVTFHLSPEEQINRVKELSAAVESIYANDNLGEFIFRTRKDFFNKHLSTDYVCPYSGITISAGTRIIKAFKYFESNQKALEQIQNLASQIIQENEVTGTFCISIHPLDFLSASENTYNWRSCHSLDGDYRAGNLSYMLDSSTVICYLRSSSGEKVALPNFPANVPWYSKKWRMWLFFEDKHEALFAGRQYPFFSMDALQIIQKQLLCTVPIWSHWHKDFIHTFPFKDDTGFCGEEADLCSRHIAMNHSIYGMYDLITEPKHAQHFNDLLYSSTYVPYYCWIQYPKQKRKLHFTIGAEVPCVRCGIESIRTEGSMLCLTCGAELGTGEDHQFGYCECCERRTPHERLHYIDGEDLYVCDNCLDLVSQCSSCGEHYYNINLIFDRETETYICASCAERWNNI